MKFLHALIFLGFASTAFVQTATDPENLKNNGTGHSIGVGGAVFDTWGFTYRHHFNSDFGIVSNLGGWLGSYTGRIGLAIGPSYTFAHHVFPKSILPHSSIRIYALAYGAAILYHEKKNANVGNLNIGSNSFSLGLGLGAGIGAEYFFNKNFSIHLELPWMTNMKIESQNGLVFDSSHPHFGGGINYYF
ncbi:MAG: hypothetical protein KC505_08555 [Myxococcales bacterium]|nr:hypothetical protein [Myxococcales bacterium]USN50245.1 MAG: hypothetical protein H6731_08225 [Myxococcales bacterium]